MADGELLDAREAMSLLGINENDLQTLVARGDLRAFRSAGTMKFRRDDVVSLKSDKPTEATIIIPASGPVRKGGSGILPTVGLPPARPASRASAPAVPAAATGHHDNATGDLLLEDIDISPIDDGHMTQAVTVQAPAAQAIGGMTVMETASQLPTGEMTVMETGVSEPDVIAPPPTQTLTGSGRRRAPSNPVMPALPQMSRVQAAVKPSVSSVTARRTQTVYQPKTSHPIMTAVLLLNSVVLILAASIVGVMMTKGTYDAKEGQRIIPPFLTEGGHFPVYRWAYKKTPGIPSDETIIPKNEYHPSKAPAAAH